MDLCYVKIKVTEGKGVQRKREQVKENEQEWELESFCICWFTLQMAAMTKTGWMWSQEPGVRSFFCVSYVDPWTILYCLLRPFARSWSESRTARTKSGMHIHACATGGAVACYTTALARHSLLFYMKNIWIALFIFRNKLCLWITI